MALNVDIDDFFFRKVLTNFNKCCQGFPPKQSQIIRRRHAVSLGVTADGQTTAEAVRLGGKEGDVGGRDRGQVPQVQGEDRGQNQVEKLFVKVVQVFISVSELYF